MTSKTASIATITGSSKVTVVTILAGICSSSYPYQTSPEISEPELYILMEPLIHAFRREDPIIKSIGISKMLPVPKLRPIAAR